MTATRYSLFDDDPHLTPTGRALTVRARAPRPLSKKEQAVNRLLKQVENLQRRFEAEKRRLDDALVFHAANVAPRRQQLTNLRADVVRVLQRYLNDSRLSKADRRVLRTILIEQLDEVLAHMPDPDDSLKALFKRLHSVGYDEAVQAELEGARLGIEAMFDELGVDIDLPELRPGMTEEDIAAAAAQFGDRMRQSVEPGFDNEPSRPRTKKEQQAAARVERFEQVRKLSIGAIYKRLVKALHPDLERDEAARERKSAIMSEVTAAYARNDLHALLRLELEWVDGEGTDATRLTDETLDAYARFLREQVASLRAECLELPLHPRYAPLVRDENPYGGAIVSDGPAEVRWLDMTLDSLRAALERMADDGMAYREVRALIQDHRRAFQYPRVRSKRRP